MLPYLSWITVNVYYKVIIFKYLKALCANTMKITRVVNLLFLHR